MSPDGTRVYISNGKDASVSVVDTTNHQILATIPVGQRPWNMGITPDGQRLYVANGKSNSISVIDTGKMAVIQEVPVGEAPWGVVVH
jgi:YVTN family beta-propeller protein